MKQDKTCKFSRKASFLSYVQQYNRKQLHQLILCPFDARKLVGGKGHETQLDSPIQTVTTLFISRQIFLKFDTLILRTLLLFSEK